MMQIRQDGHKHLTPLDKAWRYLQLDDRVPTLPGGRKGDYESAETVGDGRLRQIYADWFSDNQKKSGEGKSFETEWKDFAQKFEDRKSYDAVNTDGKPGISYDEFCLSLG